MGNSCFRTLNLIGFNKYLSKRDLQPAFRFLFPHSLRKVHENTGAPG